MRTRILVLIIAKLIFNSRKKETCNSDTQAQICAWGIAIADCFSVLLKKVDLSDSISQISI